MEKRPWFFQRVNIIVWENYATQHRLGLYNVGELMSPLAKELSKEMNIIYATKDKSCFPIIILLTNIDSSMLLLQPSSSNIPVGTSEMDNQWF